MTWTRWRYRMPSRQARHLPTGAKSEVPFLHRHGPPRPWLHVVRAARWANPPAVKKMFGSADVPRDGRVVFDIGGNKYRLVVWINYGYGTVYVRFIGTHRDYDRIDAQTV